MPLNEDGMDRTCPEYWLGYIEALTAILQRSRNLIVRSKPDELAGVMFIFRTLREMTDAAVKQFESLK